MNASELVKLYAAQIETNLGFALSDVEAELQLTRGSLEKVSALTRLQQEIQETIDEHSLIAWLEECSVPEDEWLNYDCRKGVVYWNEREAE